MMVYLACTSGWLLIGLLNYMLLDRSARGKGNFFHFVLFLIIVPATTILYLSSVLFGLLEILLFRSDGFRQS
jgi:hypothetical protein